jgi:peptide/nickel transport system ATP-binding protein/oligopeptide transport system ATP-binding protein
MRDSILEVKNLKTYFYQDGAVIKAVDDVSFSVKAGKTLGIVGESGCGKSITSLSILSLVEGPAGKIEGGRILFHDENLLEKSEREMEGIRGGKIAMIFQEPMTSLNPVYTIGYQIIEAIRLHQAVSAADARKEAIEILRRVKIPLPEKRIDEYPHQLSGGMRQRAMIAMALSCRPELLICDEPTTALDVTIQAQILHLIRDLQKEIGAAVIMITHDMGVIAETADEVMVMYAGKVVEYADADALFERPLHPYTEGLLACIPPIDTDRDSLPVIPGMVPGNSDMPAGCTFSPRCAYAEDICRRSMPELSGEDGRQVRCFRYGGERG